MGRRLALSAFLLVPDTPVGVASAAVGLLSLGYDLTQTQVMGFFTLFAGFGTDSLVFQLLLEASSTTASPRSGRSG